MTKEILDALGGIREDIGGVKTGVDMLGSGQQALGRQIVKLTEASSSQGKGQTEIERRLRIVEKKQDTHLQNHPGGPIASDKAQFSVKQITATIVTIAVVLVGIATGIIKVLGSGTP